MQSEPTGFEIDVLRDLNGEHVEGMVWGAAMGAAVEWLYGQGYITRTGKMSGIRYDISDKGKAFLAARDLQKSESQ